MTFQLSYLARIWELRYFWFSLVSNDLSNRYKRSFIGIGWSLLRPLAMTGIFCLVFGKLFNQSIAEYAPFLLLGMTTWQFISESLLSGCTCFSSGSAYIRQQQVPLAIFPLRTVLGSGFHSLVALGMAIAIVVLFQGYQMLANPDVPLFYPINPVALLSLLPGILILFVVCWSLAIVSGVIYTHFPDTQHLLEIGMQIAFYVTPILYKPDLVLLKGRGRLAMLVYWNPLTSLLALIRTPILDGTMPAAHHIQMSLLFMMVVGLSAMFLLRKLERTLVFWI